MQSAPSVLAQLREGVPDQEAACVKLHLFQEAISPWSGPAPRASTARTRLPDVAYLYGPPAVGKSDAAVLLALLLQSPSRTLRAATLADPQTALLQLRQTQPLFARCIHTIHVNVDKRKTAETALQIATLFRQVQSQLEQAEDEEANENASSGAGDARGARSVPPCVTLIFEELSQAPASFVQPLMTLFDGGYVVVDGQSVSCPVHLVILCLGNCPDDGSVLRSPEHSQHRPPSDSDLQAEVCRCLKNTALNSRVVKLIVPFFPYRRRQLPGIARRMLDRLRPELAHGIGGSARSDAFEFTQLLHTWAIQLLQASSPDYDIRSARSKTLLQLRAAANKVISQGVDLSGWAKIHFTVTASGHIVVQEHMFPPEVPLRDDALAATC